MAARRILAIALFIIPLTLAKPVFAAISSCSASVTPNTVNTSTQSNFTFTIQNTDSSNTVRWIKITRPSSNFTLGGYSIAGWSVSTTSDAYTLTGGTLAPSASIQPLVQATSGSSEAASANWTVQASDDSGGASPTSCTGTLGTAISGNPPDTTPPTISNIVVTDVGDTSLKITWTTDEASTSSVDYGLTDEYGTNSSDNTIRVTAHSISLAGLTANTTYHYNVSGSDASGNSSSSGDNTFVTAKKGTTGTTQAGTTVTKLITPTPTPTPTPDITPPSVVLVTKLEKAYKTSPTLTGKTSDAGGVATIDFSNDGGRNWTSVESKDLGKTSITFSFTPALTEDGSYLVKLRAKDKKGNTGYSKVATLVIDRLPPQIAGTVLSFGPHILEPDATGAVTTVTGLTHRLTVSVVGGPTWVEIVFAGQTVMLAKNVDNGLWGTDITFATPGTYELVAKSIDAVANKTERAIGRVHVLAGGRVQALGNRFSDVTLTVHYQNPVIGAFVPWNAASYGQKNPVGVTDRGSYSLFLPPGQYFIEVRSPFYQTVKTNIFTLLLPTPISESFQLVPKRILKVAAFTIPLPDFRLKYHTVELTDQFDQSNPQESPLIGSPLPDFSLERGEETVTNVTFRGKPTVLTFLSLWSPVTPGELSELFALARDRGDLNIVPIALHHSQSALNIFSKRGKYNLSFIADPDGKLVEPFNLTYLPLFVIVDRRGIVRAVYEGKMTAKDIMTSLGN